MSVYRTVQLLLYLLYLINKNSTVYSPRDKEARYPAKHIYSMRNDFLMDVIFETTVQTRHILQSILPSLSMSLLYYCLLLY